MKTIVLFLLIISFTVSFAQIDSVNRQQQKLYLITSYKSNISGSSKPGMGFKLGIGYKIGGHFSLILSTGYMTSYSDPYRYTQQRSWDFAAQDYLETTMSHERQDNKYVPVDLSLRYNFDVFGVQSYAFYEAGWHFWIDEGNYIVTRITKYEKSNKIIETKSDLASNWYNISETSASIGSGVGLGILIPVSTSINIDLSYSLLRNQALHSIGLGINIGIK